jgi:nickel/cobalt transporter (NicO) family protein
MNTTTSSVILGLAASVAVVHTAVGIDHAVPFVVLSRVQGWSLKRTLIVTALCGVGHIASAVVIGFAAVGLGLAVDRLGPLEALRGKLGLGILVAFGLGYAALGAVRLIRKTHGHRHVHVHEDGTVHAHDHEAQRKKVVTTWTLFVVLVFGPCEALVPLLLAPGVAGDFALLAEVIALFGLLTVLTMLVLVTLGVLGTRLVSLEKLGGPRLAATSDVLAGLAIAATGIVVASFGL